MLANVLPKLHKLVIKIQFIAPLWGRLNSSTTHAEQISRYYSTYKEPYTWHKLLKSRCFMELSTEKAAPYNNNINTSSIHYLLILTY